MGCGLDSLSFIGLFVHDHVPTFAGKRIVLGRSHHGNVEQFRDDLGSFGIRSANTRIAILVHPSMDGLESRSSSTMAHMDRTDLYFVGTGAWGNAYVSMDCVVQRTFGDDVGPSSTMLMCL